MTSVLFGATLGLGVKLYSNAVRKLPYMREPWEHVIYIGLGAWAGSAFSAWNERKEAQLREQIQSYQHANNRYSAGSSEVE